MTTLCIDVPYNYVYTAGTVYGEIRYKNNSTLKPTQKSKVRLPNDLLGKKLRLVNYRFLHTTEGGHTGDPTTTYTYFGLSLSCGGKTSTNSYLISHEYSELASFECTTEDVIALPYLVAKTDACATYPLIHLPAVSNIEMYIEVTSPVSEDVTDWAFRALTLWFEVL